MGKLYIRADLADGAKVIGDEDDPAWGVVLKAGQWEEGMSRERAEQLINENAEDWKKNRGPDSVIGQEMDESRRGMQDPSSGPARE